MASTVEPSDTMTEKNKEGKAKATVSPKSSAPVKVSKSTPIIVKKRDLSPRAIGLEILARSYLGEMDLEMAKRRALRYENRNISDEEAVLALLTELHAQLRGHAAEGQDHGEHRRVPVIHRRGPPSCA